MAEEVIGEGSFPWSLHDWDSLVLRGLVLSLTLWMLLFLSHMLAASLSLPVSKVLLAWGFFSTEVLSVRKSFAIYSKSADITLCMFAILK